MFNFIVKGDLIYRFNKMSGETWVISPWNKWIRVEEPK